MRFNIFSSTRVIMVLVGGVLCLGANAALFEDDEARRAILELRQRISRQDREIQNFQHSLLMQENQFEVLRQEIARLRGEKEELMQELRRAKEQTQIIDDRLKRFEPVRVKVDGVEFLAEPSETKAYEDALALFRKGDFVSASAAFSDFIKRYPTSGYSVSALFWLGNAQYANRDYVNAIKNFNNLLSKAPTHERAPDAMLSVANCQLELKDTKAARKTLSELVKTYPNSEAAAAVSERLAKLKG